MYVLISPAKTLNFEHTLQEIEKTQPIFVDETKTLVNAAKKLQGADIQNLMGVSETIAHLNYERYQNFYKQETKQAILAFQGDVYKGLDVETLDPETLSYASHHLGILSGLYGLLRAGDMMHPYRLEMGLSFAVGNYKNLYEFWGDKITHAINQEVGQSKSAYILNLASQEYAGAIQRKAVEKPVLDIVFYDEKPGKPAKVIGIYAKKARGLMARAVLQNRWKSVDDLCQFDTEGYRFDKKQSDDSTLVFRRKHK